MRILISAGELSGSMHAAQLVKAWRKRDPSVVFCGMGGTAMADAGVQLLVNSDQQLSFMGFSGIFKKLGQLYSAWKALTKLIADPKSRPDWLILVDYGGFNLPLAWYAKRYQVKVCYYIPPKTWASRAWRLALLRRWVTCVAVIFPFEANYFNRHQVKAYYVGNPTLQRLQPLLSQQRAVTLQPPPPAASIALMPGSRAGEVNKLLPIMLQALNKIANVKIYLVPAANLDLKLYNDILANFPQLKVQLLAAGDLSTVYHKCHAAIVASGTATLELGLLNVPAVVVYRLSWIEYLLARMVITVSYVALSNILVNKAVVTELLQDDCNPKAIQKELLALLYQKEHLQKVLEGYQALRDALQGPSADLIDVLTHYNEN